MASGMPGSASFFLQICAASMGIAGLRKDVLRLSQVQATPSLFAQKIDSAWLCASAYEVPTP